MKQFGTRNRSFAFASPTSPSRASDDRIISPDISNYLLPTLISPR
jgi:hypothetical protein